jgi:hypothetical protein
LLDRLSIHGYGEDQLVRLEELQTLLLPVPVTLTNLLDIALRNEEYSILKSFPKTMANNVDESCVKLGVSKEQFVTAALKKPSLFWQKPETLRSNVEENSAKLGVSKEQFVTAALRKPNLFYQKPETLTQHAHYIRRIMKHLDEKRTLGEFITAYPTSLTLANENLLGRTILAQQGACPTKSAGKLINKINKRDLQALLVEHYTGRVVENPQTKTVLNAGERVIQTLHHIGALDKLPDGMEPLKDAHSIAMLDRVLAAREAKKGEQNSKTR